MLCSYAKTFCLNAYGNLFFNQKLEIIFNISMNKISWYLVPIFDDRLICQSTPYNCNKIVKVNQANKFSVFIESE